MVCRYCGKESTDGIEVCAWCGKVNTIVADHSVEKKFNIEEKITDTSIMNPSIEGIQTQKRLFGNVGKNFSLKHITIGILTVAVVIATVVGITQSGGKQRKKKSENIESENVAEASDELNIVEDVSEKQTVEIREGFILQYDSIVNDSAIPISTVEDLQNIEEGSDKYYILMNDIDMEGRTVKVRNFAGIFEGNYHHIKNAGEAIFSSVEGGTVQNLAVVDSTASVAGIAECLWDGTISNCYVTGEIGKNTTEEYEYVGGIVAEVIASNSRIFSCYNTATIYEADKSAGGIVGNLTNNSNSGESFLISGCENYGNIVGDGGNPMAGICGELIFESMDTATVSGTIDQCVNYGTVEENDAIDAARNYGLAGVLGYARVQSDNQNAVVNLYISRCANYGQMLDKEESHAVSGGICGYLSLEQRETTGAKVTISSCLNRGEEDAGMCNVIDGYKGTVEIANCLHLVENRNHPVYAYVYGNVNETPAIRVSNCYYLDDTSGNQGHEAESVSEADVKDEAYLEERGFDIFSTWKISSDVDNGYPHIMTQEEWQEIESQGELEN